MIRSGEAPAIGWSRSMLYSGFNTLPRSVVRRQIGFAARISIYVIRLTAKQMKTFSAGYLLFVTTAIAVLFTVPPWVLPESNPESPLEGFGIQILVGIGHGMSICLFFHLITKGVGLSLGWRIFLSAAIPVAIYMSIMLWALQYMSNGILRFAPFMLGFYTVKFLTCSVMAEYTMLDLQRRFKWFGTAPLPPGG